MKIGVIGLRSLPDVQGGIETHCENLYPLLHQKGYDIYVFRRKKYNRHTDKTWRSLNFIDLPSLPNRYLENIVHSFRSIVRARRLGLDIVHIHGIGPALLTPLARLMGLKVVLTHHGKDYKRAKWNRFARWMLRKGEKTGLKGANHIVLVAPMHFDSNYAKSISHKTTVIPNGLPGRKEPSDKGILERYGLTTQRYILAVGRLVEEKGFDCLIEAFRKSRLTADGYKLVIAGADEFNSSYSRKLKGQADDVVIFTGNLTHSELQSLYAEASLFVLPSCHEGLSISLLEAMGNRLPLLVSDIPENRLPEIPSDSFFITDNVDDLAAKLSDNRHINGRIDYDMSRFNWNDIADKTALVYESVSSLKNNKL